METFRLPGGSYTTDSKKYAQEWKELGDKLSDKYNVEVLGYDPFIRVGRGYSTADLPVWLVKEMLK